MPSTTRTALFSPLSSVWRSATLLLVTAGATLALLIAAILVSAPATGASAAPAGSSSPRQTSGSYTPSGDSVTFKPVILQ